MDYRGEDNIKLEHNSIHRERFRFQLSIHFLERMKFNAVRNDVLTVSVRETALSILILDTLARVKLLMLALHREVLQGIAGPKEPTRNR